MPDEIELKLRIDRRHAARLRQHPAILAAASGKPITRKLTSIYFDTPQLTLLDAGINLRVRRMSGEWFQAVKGGGSVVSGLHQRMEWEDIIAGNQPDFTKILEPSLHKLFADQALRDALKPIFTTEVRRTEWQLEFDNGDRIELALDTGNLVIGSKKEPISEIELELKAGKPGRLFDLALELQLDIPLELENVSKSQHGYEHYRKSAKKIVKSRPPALARDMSAHDAFRQIAWECLSHLQGNQAMVLQGEDVEGVHQMRVALRRLRSAFAVFRRVVGKEGCIGMLNELRWITDVLGAARDLDVFITQTLPPVTEHLHHHPGLLLLRDNALVEKKKAYAAARAAIHSQRYQRMILTLGAWLENERWRDSIPTAEQKVQGIAYAVLTKRHKELRQHGQRLVHMHPEERHATRIAAKKLRYAAEFFTELYPSAKPRRFIQSLAHLQDVLGLLNDVAVTENLIHHLIGQRPSRALDEALHLFNGWNGCNTRHGLAHMEDVWRSFARTPAFWQS